ncbi:MAG TPA: bifunctional pantoate--beta-alanine ligase/(d)CMP kinase [Crinalium sp.]
MRLFTTVAGLRCYLNLETSGLGISKKPEGAKPVSSHDDVTVGLVPTMGALHAGHLSLVERARRENQIVVVSIFVNPLQFGPNEDFQRYPRTLERDRQLCEQAGVDAIFAPSALELYGAHSLDLIKVTQVIPPAAMMAELCGRSRPGHFQGVATVVTKLFNLVQPDRAYFGQKDAQQLAILQRMSADLNIPVEIVPCPIVREPDGLALSSRNQYLTTEQQSQAPVLYRSLQRAEQLFRQGHSCRIDLISAVKDEIATVSDVRLEYVELVHPATMTPIENIEETGLLAIAAHLGTTRLIDNILLRKRQPIIAIDGPAGAGKSTVARQVAQALGLLYLDTGAMYRAVTWLVQQSEIDLTDEPAIAELVSRCDIRLENGDDGMVAERTQASSDAPHTPLMLKPLKVWIDGQEVTQAIRHPDVTAQVSAIAALPTVRRELVKRQQDYGRTGGVVMDGRDIGTFVFPDAELKIFLTASVQERARRRQLDLRNQGQPEISLSELEQLIHERDYKDSTRAIAPLQKAKDAIEIKTDGFTVDEVTAQIVTLYQTRLDT